MNATINPNIRHMCGECKNMFTVSVGVKAHKTGENNIKFEKDGKSIMIRCDVYELHTGYKCPHCQTVLWSLQVPREDIDQRLIEAGILVDTIRAKARNARGAL